MNENGYLERFQKRHSRESAKALLKGQVDFLTGELGKMEAFQLGMYNAGKTTGPEWEKLCATLQDGEEKVDGLKKALLDIEAQEVAEKVK